MLNFIIPIIVIVVLAIGAYILQTQYNAFGKVFSTKENFSMENHNFSTRFTNLVDHMLDEITTMAANYIVINSAEMEDIKIKSKIVADNILQNTEYGKDNVETLYDELKKELPDLLTEEFQKFTSDPMILGDINDKIHDIIIRDIRLLKNYMDVPYPVSAKDITIDDMYAGEDQTMFPLDLTLAQRQKTAVKYGNTLDDIKFGPRHDKVLNSLLPENFNKDSLIHGTPRYGMINARNGRTTYDPRGMIPALADMLVSKSNTKDPHSLQRSAHTASIRSTIETGKGFTNSDEIDSLIDKHGEKHGTRETVTEESLMDRFVDPIHVRNHRHADNLSKNIMYDIHHGLDTANANIHA